MNPQEAFLDVLIAAMNDAAIERKLTQLHTTITPPGHTKAKLIRIIVIPDALDVTFPKDQPLGTDPKGN